jgi:hypothetical protein
MTYAKASKNIYKSIEETIDKSSLEPWKDIDTELKTALLDDASNMKVIAMLSDGVIFSMVLAQQVLDSRNAGAGKTEEEIAKESNLVMLDIVSTALLRAFALGVRCQKSVSEVDLLESLVGIE